MNIVIIIPAYNPPNNFIDLLSEIRKVTSLKIIIIDDCSIKPVKITSKISNFKLFRNPTNKGKGGALKKGFQIAYKNKFTHAITMDADFQHSPNDIINFINIQEDYSIIYGKREFYSPMPIHRRLSNFITSKTISFIFKSSIFDSQCGFRRYKLEDIKKIVINETGYQYETELLIKAIQMNLSISSVLISTIYSNEISNLRYFKNIYSFLKLIILLSIEKKK